MKGKVIRSLYELVDSRWILIESSLEDSIIDYAHWKSWKQFDGDGATLRGTTLNGERVMKSYTTYSPNGIRKATYKLIIE